MPVAQKACNTVAFILYTMFPSKITEKSFATAVLPVPFKAPKLYEQERFAVKILKFKFLAKGQ